MAGGRHFEGTEWGTRNAETKKPASFRCRLRWMGLPADGVTQDAVARFLCDHS